MTSSRALRPAPIDDSFGTTELADALGVAPERFATMLNQFAAEMQLLGLVRRSGSGRPRRFTAREVVHVAALYDVHDPEPVVVLRCRKVFLRAVLDAEDGADVAVQVNDRLTMHYRPRWDLPAQILESR